MITMLRKIKLLFQGLLTFSFSSWLRWIGWRSRIVKPSRDEAIFKIRGGPSFYCRPGIDIGFFQEMYLQNNYMRRYAIKADDIVIDIGAHLGTFSIFAATQAPRVKVWGYEPIPKLFSLFERNVALNNLKANVTPFMFGIAAKDGETDLYFTVPDVGGSTTPEIRFSEATKRLGEPKSIRIKTKTLVDIFEKNNISQCDFLKMDCEGAEFESILNTPPEVLKKISHMTIEYHLNPKPLIDFLSGIGFSVEQKPLPAPENVGFLYVERS
jgi:FkbM family methyltransferase